MSYARWTCENFPAAFSLTERVLTGVLFGGAAAGMCVQAPSGAIPGRKCGAPGLTSKVFWSTQGPASPDSTRELSTKQDLPGGFWVFFVRFPGPVVTLLKADLLTDHVHVRALRLAVVF